MNGKKKNGFTLIELIVVIAIIAILAAVALPRMSGYTQTAKKSKIEASAENVYRAALAYDAAKLKASTNTNINFSQDDIGPYLSSNVSIVSGKGQPNTNTYGHYTGTLKDGEACVHLLRPGDIYTAAGFPKNNPATEDTYIIEMLNEEGVLTYYKFN